MKRIGLILTLKSIVTSTVLLCKEIVMNVTFMPEEVFGSVELQPFAEKPKQDEKPQNSYGGKRKKEKFVYLHDCFDPSDLSNNLAENPFREGCNND